MKTDKHAADAARIAELEAERDRLVAEVELYKSTCKPDGQCEMRRRAKHEAEQDARWRQLDHEQRSDVLLSLVSDHDRMRLVRCVGSTQLLEWMRCASPKVRDVVFALLPVGAREVIAFGLLDETRLPAITTLAWADQQVADAQTVGGFRNVEPTTATMPPPRHPPSRTWRREVDAATADRLGKLGIKCRRGVDDRKPTASATYYEYLGTRLPVDAERLQFAPPQLDLLIEIDFDLAAMLKSGELVRRDMTAEQVRAELVRRHRWLGNTVAELPPIGGSKPLARPEIAA